MGWGMRRIGLVVIWGCRLFLFATLILVAATLVIVQLNQSFPTGYWYFDYGSLIAVVASAVLAPFAMFPTTPDHLNVRRVLATLSLEALLLCVGLASFFALYGSGNTQKFVPISIIVSGSLATLGWITSAILTVHSWQISHDNSALAVRKQQSLAILLGMRQNELFQLHSASVLNRFPFGTVLTPEAVNEMRQERDKWNYFPKDDGNVSYPTWESIVWLANYYEFIAIGIRNSNLDEELFKDSIRMIVVRFHDKVKALIDYVQQQENERAYIHLRELVTRWRSV
jgi:Domain of unknown function (DUF4760)